MNNSAILLKYVLSNIEASCLYMEDDEVTESSVSSLLFENCLNHYRTFNMLFMGKTVFLVVQNIILDN